MAIRVLFLCTGNSARSQMAEHLLRSLGGDRFEVFSAGTRPQGVHPMTIKVLNDLHIDASKATSKKLDVFLDAPFDYVITVCDNAKDACPIFPGGAKQLHWGFEDPAAARGDEATQLQEFRRISSEISNRISIWIADMNQSSASRL